MKNVFGPAVALLGLLAVWPPRGGFAQAPADPLVTDRPDFTESAQTVPARRAQLEGGLTVTRTGDERDAGVGELLLRIGLTRRLELRVGFPTDHFLRGGAGQGNRSGFDDATLGVKVKIADAAPGFGLSRRPDVALIVLTSLPTGDLGENVAQPEAKLCLGWGLSEHLALSSNLNYGRPSENGERFDQFSGSVSLARALSDRTGAYLEYFGFAPGGKNAANVSYLNTGLTYLVNADFQLDARAGVGLNGEKNDHFVGFGASRRF